MSAVPATADADKPTPIVIKRIVKGHGHHGGAWKVAFADFATAMMAFFMLMWLMGSTTKEQKGGISEYFNNPSDSPGTSSTPAPTPVQGPGGASTSMIQAGGGSELYKEPPKTSDAATPTTPPAQVKEVVKVVVKETAAENGEAERLKGLKDELEKAIQQRESLRDFKDQILLDLTPEGLRIQIVDKDRRSMFALGSATLEDYSVSLIKQIAAIISTVPNRISVTGHTDDKPYIKPNYGNWELSADRANAARRALIAGGIAQNKIGRVVGLGSTAPLNSQDKMDPINRRMSIVVMNRQTEDNIARESGTLLSMQHPDAAGASAGGGTVDGGQATPVDGSGGDAAGAAAPAAN